MNNIKNLMIFILFWILFWTAMWWYMWYKLINNNYIITKWKAIQIKNTIEKNNERIINKVKEIKNNFELTSSEIDNILKEQKYKKEYLIIEDVKDNRTIAKKINYWFIYWKRYRTEWLKKYIPEFITNDFQVNYTIKTKNEMKNFKLNCILNTKTLNLLNLEISLWKDINDLYCSKKINDFYQKKYSFLYDKKYKNILSTVNYIKNTIQYPINIWTANNIIKNIILKYK